MFPLMDRSIVGREAAAVAQLRFWSHEEALRGGVVPTGSLFANPANEVHGQTWLWLGVCAQQVHARIGQRAATAIVQAEVELMRHA